MELYEKVREVEIRKEDKKQNMMCCECGNSVKRVYYGTDLDIMCSRCYSRMLANNLHKNLAKCRNKEIAIDSRAGVKYISMILTSRFLGMKTCFEVTDDFSCDTIHHDGLGKICVKGRRPKILQDGEYSYIFPLRRGIYNRMNSGMNDIDTLFTIGFSDDMTDVECVYIFPRAVIQDLNVSTIYINMSWMIDKYYEYSNDTKVWNDILHSLNLERCPILSE